MTLNAWRKKLLQLERAEYAAEAKYQHYRQLLHEEYKVASPARYKQICESEVRWYFKYADASTAVQRHWGQHPASMQQLTKMVQKQLTSL